MDLQLNGLTQFKYLGVKTRVQAHIHTTDTHTEHTFLCTYTVHWQARWELYRLLLGVAECEAGVRQEVSGEQRC